jgi:hypothetical protein
LSDRFWGVCPTESRAEAILSEAELGCPIVQCPNADPCLDEKTRRKTAKMTLIF